MTEHGPRLLPDDPHDRALLAHVRPPGWVNPTPGSRYDLVVLGGGTAGLVAASAAAGLGARVALVEAGLLGGDCLVTGCVPSKALLRSSRTAADVGRAASLGVHVEGATPDFPAIMERVRRLRSRIGAHDAAQRLRSKGVDVHLGAGRFARDGIVEVGGTPLRYRKAIIATGARPAVPDVPGLADAGFLTNETVFALTRMPRSLGVIGGGPMGCELAQAFRRLGCEVTLVQSSAHLLDREDADASAVIESALARDGVRLALGARLQRVDVSGDSKLLRMTHAGREETVSVEQVLVAAGRTPNVEGLGLETVGVVHDVKRGVHVDDRLRTTHRLIHAAGDVCLSQKFTHAADFSARVAVRNSLFLGSARVSALTIPWVTYTDPEVAHVGLTEREAAERGIALDTFVRPLAEVDRAIVDGDEEGFVKIHVRRGGDSIVGATIVARHAGEMIGEVAVALAAGMGLGRLANVVHPYPTQAEAIRQAGDLYNRTRLTPSAAWLLRAWLAACRWR